ncbi:MAG: hypothetical protein HXS41_06955 [Theionarchaea archaeon]|nr:hypothetical protein [Theionarchaea archaeon]
MHKKGKLTLLAVCTAAMTCYAVASVTAYSYSLPHTPLFAFRMGQQSNGNNFLPTATDDFKYSAEGGYNLNYGNGGCLCSFGAKFFAPLTCATCDEEMCGQLTICLGTCSTCQGMSTCCYTCYNTCVNTCSTCVNTCSNTCVNTCSSTCVNTCSSTCVNTCSTCVSTCYTTCAATC